MFKKGLNNFFKRKRKSLITVEQLELLDQSNIEEAEKIVETLKEEESEARLKLVENLKDIFNDLPIVLF